MSEHHPHGPWSTPALISYGILAVWTLTVGATFALIATETRVADVMVGILGAILSTASAGVGAVTGYWLAASAATTRKDPPKSGEEAKP